MLPTLELRNIGQIREANLSFGDLTVFVGPQASGKSIALQWLKLVLDTGQVQAQLRQYGMDWHRKSPEFLDLYFGEGMKSLWKEGKSQLRWNREEWDATSRIQRMAKDKRESAFFIPAQRVLALRDGWPRPFSDYSAGDPFSVRWFSEKLRLLMEQELGSGEAVFPKSNRLKQEYRALIEQAIFGPFRLSVDAVRSQKRLVLGQAAGQERLPYMVWSAGQREFVPLLLGLYWLMPPTKVSRKADVEWVIIEEPEMGMHPRAISTILLLVLELLHRGYRVCVSTHSPLVLDLVWILQVFQEKHERPGRLLEVFAAPKKTSVLLEVAEDALKKECKVYFFEGQGGAVRDITGLNPDADESHEAMWGGLLEFSGRVNDAVASAVANADDGAAA